VSLNVNFFVDAAKYSRLKGVINLLKMVGVKHKNATVTLE